ncbi:chorismate-binding protein [Candidatus Haliotispira prima]|uniref:Chorismate-binding protein n=1 Tax=Candidatus Haliotispira prima TaxID=3034016 RepID=A0ABY8MJN4_9SPIO|nr:chorismate-binding protein [Candidatus Haliotispira prima]
MLPVFLEIFFMLCCREPGFFWLDSGDGRYAKQNIRDGHGVDGANVPGRFAFFGLRPEHRLQYYADQSLHSSELFPGGQKKTVQHLSPKGVLDVLEQLAGRYQFSDSRGPAGFIPFHSGLVGAFAYEFGYYLQEYFYLGRHSDPAQFCRNKETTLLLEFAAYPAVLAVDMELNQIYILGKEQSSAFSLLREKLSQSLRMALTRARHFGNFGNTDDAENSRPDWQLHGQYNFAEYCQKFTQVQEYLEQGEIYQLNLTQKLRLSADLGGQSAETAISDLYLQLRRRHPVPFGCFYRFGSGRHLLSFSPERFFRLCWKPSSAGGQDEGHLLARPMKGTRPRSAQPELDRQGYDKLCQSPKERAELLMICDLLRNDLYRICHPSSVRVAGGSPDSWPFIIEKYSSVWTQVAAISGTLGPEFRPPGRQKDRDSSCCGSAGVLSDLWQALFPCGSITGAPKMRAMELIGELENSQRQWYTGNFGYIDGNGNMEFNVLIRSFYSEESSEVSARNLALNYHVGGGVVRDSEPHAEWLEQEAKCRFFLETLGLSFPG